ncbi:MAG TPA: glycosyltransferase [Bacteroidales bacterium]|nr:glycosyltransferase [Bacteroidales bacterium]HRZ49865.1 glycosyltransferase [Bacteroidales bacterium]
MKTLSVIIVNYNVVHFLEQCLISVQSACRDLDTEVIVVDNNSVDGSIAMVREKFPDVTLIANRENVGFSRANNQGILASEGKYVLLLNPDTVVEPDTFRKCVAFMEGQPDGGALGVYMVNGKGEYLPESKRSLPTPAVAFYKIFGLSSLFPRSHRFGRYHLGFLDKNQTHEVEVLSGAFMLLRREALDKTGLLDETFFMYGEDIDLSYRITKAGYKNYYYPGTRIIHFKGESTKKSSLNYVFVFYQAMAIFARKHFSGSNARLFSFLIHVAIYFRASVAIARRTLSRLLFPVADAALIWAGFWFLKQYWAEKVTFGSGSDYPVEFMRFVVPAYIAVWLVSMFFSGAYDRPVNLARVLRGMGIGTLVILVVYALLPESLRYSRALILLGFMAGSAALTAYRYILGLTRIPAFDTGKAKLMRLAVIGNREEAERVVALIRKTDPAAGVAGVITPEPEEDFPGLIGHLGQMREITSIYQINELIFCQKDLSAKAIIDLMTGAAPGITRYRIAPPETLYLVGSGSIHSSSDLYLFSLNAITSPANRRNKRLLDLLASVLLLALWPLMVLIQKSPGGFFINCFRVIAGKRSWVGYHAEQDTAQHPALPAIRPGIFHPADGIRIPITDAEMIQRLNLLYARDYRIHTDLLILWKNIRKIGTCG